MFFVSTEKIYGYKYFLAFYGALLTVINDIHEEMHRTR